MEKEQNIMILKDIYDIETFEILEKDNNKTLFVVDEAHIIKTLFSCKNYFYRMFQLFYKSLRSSLFTIYATGNPHLQHSYGFIHI